MKRLITILCSALTCLFVFAVVNNIGSENIRYSWSSVNGTVSEVGGTVSLVDADDYEITPINYFENNKGCYVLRLSSEYEDDFLVTLDTPFEPGDTLKFEGYVYYSRKSTSHIKLTINGRTEVIEDKFVNLFSESEPNVISYVIPDYSEPVSEFSFGYAENSNTQMYITKVEVVKESKEPAITIISPSEDAEIESLSEVLFTSKYCEDAINYEIDVQSNGESLFGSKPEVYPDEIIQQSYYQASFEPLTLSKGSVYTIIVKAFGKRNALIAEKTITVKGATETPYVDVVVEPSDETALESLTEITFVANDIIQQASEETLTIGNSTLVKAESSDITKLVYKVVPAITADGQYKLSVPEKYFSVANAFSSAIEKTYTVKFTYSDVKFVSVKPQEDPITTTAKNIIDVTFSDAARIVSAVAVCGNDEVQATAKPTSDDSKWTVTVPASFLNNVKKDFVLNIYATDAYDRVIKGNEGEYKDAHESTTINCNVGAPSLVVTPESGSSLESIKEIQITYPDGIKLNDRSAKITMGTSEFTLKDFSDNGYTYTLSAPVTKVGSYTIKIPAGMFLLGGEEYVSKATSVNYVIEAQYKDLVKITPKENAENLETLENFVLELTPEKEFGALARDAADYKPYIINDNTGVKVKADMPQYKPEIHNEYGDYYAFDIHLQSIIRTAGNYTLVFPKGCFKLGRYGSTDSPEMKFHYSIKAGDVDYGRITFGGTNTSNVELEEVLQIPLKLGGTGHSDLTLMFNDCTVMSFNKVPEGGFTLLNSEGKVVATATHVRGGGKNVGFIISNEVSEPGMYTFHIPGGFLNLAYPNGVKMDYTEPIDLQIEITPYSYGVDHVEGREIYNYSTGEYSKDVTFTVTLDCEKSKSVKVLDVAESPYFEEELAGGKTRIYGCSLTTRGTKVYCQGDETFPRGHSTYMTLYIPAGTLSIDGKVYEHEVKYSFDFYVTGEPAPVAIDDINVSSDKVTVYNLQGVKVAEGKRSEVLDGLRGLYIVNGKKIMLNK